MMMTVCLIWFCHAGLSAELFVDQKHADAKDDNPGTETKPFKTIQPAVDVVKPGDTIWIKAGIYSEPVKEELIAQRIREIKAEGVA